MKTKLIWMGLAVLLLGCPFGGWSSGLPPPPGEGGGASGTFLLSPDRDGTATVVARWSSGRGPQNVRVHHQQVPDDDLFRRTVTITLPDGKKLSNMESDGVVDVIDGSVTCKSSRCDLEAVAQVTIEYLGDSAPIEGDGEAVEVWWNVAFAISPKDSDVKVSDLVVEVLDQDAGVP